MESLNYPNPATEGLHGLVERTGRDTYTVRPVGVTSPTDIPTKQDNDALYPSLSHTHAQVDVTNLVADLAAKMAATTTLNNIPAPTGSVNINDQQMLSMRIENRTSDPGTPTTGQIWLRTDL